MADANIQNISEQLKLKLKDLNQILSLTKLVP